MGSRLLAAGLTAALHLALGLALAGRLHPWNATLPPSMDVVQCRLLEPVPAWPEAAPAMTTASDNRPSSQEEAPPPRETVKPRAQVARPAPAPPRRVRPAPKRPTGPARGEPEPAKPSVQGLPPDAGFPTPPPQQPPVATGPAAPAASPAAASPAAASPAAASGQEEVPALLPPTAPTVAAGKTVSSPAAPLPRRPVAESRPQYQETPKPPYPALARRMGYQGTVELELLVTVEGRVGETRMARSSGYSLLDDTAMATVQRWRFEPGTRDGDKVAMWIKVPVTFSLR